MIEVKKIGEKWNSSLVQIGRLLEELAIEIDEALPEELGDIEFSYAGVTYWRYGPRSNVGFFGPGFWVENDYCRELVSTDQKPGSHFYLNGDFNVSIYIAGRKERRETAKKLPEFFKNFTDWLRNMSQKTVQAEELLKRLVSVSACSA